jgi:hypothetical protein
VTPAKAAAVFGASLAAKGDLVDLHGFADECSCTGSVLVTQCSARSTTS